MVLRKRIGAGIATSLLLICSATLVASAWPAPYHGQPLHTEDGVLVDFGNGMKAGALMIRTVSGATQQYSTLSTTFQHRHVACFTMPTATLNCPDWPSQIVPKVTVVRVTYWIGETGYPGPGGPGRIAKDVSAL
jgi:hypothetical protein